MNLKQSVEYFWAKLAKRARGAAVRGSTVHPSATVEPGSLFVGSTMGRHSFCGYDCEISATDIGPFCSIANRVAIGGGRHPTDWVSTSPVFYEGRDSVRKKYSTFARPPLQRVHIGADVWIGFRAIIMQGVTIGHGAVVGANAVVTREVPPYAIVVGSPAKVVGYRFVEDVRERLLASRWWDLSDTVLEACASDIRHPETFLASLAKCA